MNLENDEDLEDFGVCVLGGLMAERERESCENERESEESEGGLWWLRGVSEVDILGLDILGFSLG